MATWAYAEFYTVVVSGNGFTVQSSQAVSGTLDTGFPDSTFSNGEQLNGGQSPTPEPFYGTVTSSGSTYVYTYNATLYGLPGSPVLATGTTFTNAQINTNPYTVCFCAGTLIATPRGEIPVEQLAIGDMVTTAQGTPRHVRWIGRQTVHAVFANPVRDYPIQIRAGALADGMPRRDLFVSPDHALLLDGVLVHAGALVNGTSICRVARPAETFVYYHVELEHHALLLAENTPAETFIGDTIRRRFDNHAEYVALYGEDDHALYELDLPRAMSKRQIPRATLARLARRAAGLGQLHRGAWLWFGDRFLGKSTDGRPPGSGRTRRHAPVVFTVGNRRGGTGRSTKNDGRP
jgi:hypothetical protein